MGLYSNIAANQIKVQEFSKNFSNFGLLEFAINCEQNNQRMFDTMIELDFQEAVNNMSGKYLTEAEESKTEEKKAGVVKGLLEKIKQFFKKFVDTIVAAVSKFKQNFLQFIKANERLTKKIGKLDASKLKDALNNFEDLKSKYKDVKFAKFQGDNAYNALGNDAKEINKIREDAEKEIFNIPFDDVVISRTMADEAKEINLADFQEKVNKCVKDAKDKLKKFDTYWFESDIKKAFFTEVEIDKYISDSSYVDALFDNINGGYKKMSDEINAVVYIAEEAKNQAERFIKEELKQNEAIKKSQKNVSAYYDVSISRDHAVLAVSSFTSAKFAKLLSMGIRIAVERFKNDRASYAKLGAIKLAAEKKAKDSNKNTEAKTESALMLEFVAIDLANNEFVESIFA